MPSSPVVRWPSYSSMYAVECLRRLISLRSRSGAGQLEVARIGEGMVARGAGPPGADESTVEKVGD